MGKTKKEQELLLQELEAAESKITIGARYWHYKSKEKIYEVIGLGFTEEDNELCVIYRACYGKELTFIRPLSVWLETVEWEGETLPRFTKLND